MAQLAVNCEIIKVAANDTERRLDYWIDKLSRETATGWHPDTMPMRDLKHAAYVLRALANIIEDLRLKLIGEGPG